MGNRIAIVSIIIEDRAESAKINAILSEYGDYIIGRMGVPYRQKNLYVMCVIVDASAEILNTLTGKIGMLPRVTAKTLMSKA